MRQRQLLLTGLGALVLSLSVARGATAQDLGVGVTFVGDDRGTGLIVDYSKPIRAMNSNVSLGWVGDFSISHDGFGNDFVGVEGGVTTTMFQGGLRLKGQPKPKFAWHGQVIGGLIYTRFGANITGLNTSVCDAYNIDCSRTDSDTGGVITFGGAAQYSFTPKFAGRAQLDFPIIIGTNGGGTDRLSFMLVWHP